MNPGWYPDPDDNDARRYWDGQSWSAPLGRNAASAPQDQYYPTYDTPQHGGRQERRRRVPVFGPLLIAAGLIVAVIFTFFVHPSADVPIYGSQSCGQKAALDLTLTSRDDVELAMGDAVGGDETAQQIGETFISDCYDEAHQDLWIAGLSLLAGLVLGTATAARERRN